MKVEFSMELPDRYFDPTKWPHGSCTDLEFEGWCDDCGQHSKVCKFQDKLDDDFFEQTMKGV